MFEIETQKNKKTKHAKLKTAFSLFGFSTATN